MKRLFYIMFFLVLLVIFGCEPENFHYSESWGALINSDGSGFKWLTRGYREAFFTQDSDKLVYLSDGDGIFTIDSDNKIEQISSYPDYYISVFPDLKYLLKEDDGDIFRMDLDGSNRINLTQTPDCREYDSKISSDSNWITYASVKDTIYSIWIIDVNGMNKREVLSDTLKLSRPVLNIKNNSIFYTHSLSYIKRILKSINLDDYTIATINTNDCIPFIVSGSGDVVVFMSHDDNGQFIKTEFCSFDINSGQTTLLPVYPHDGRFSLDWEGTTVVIGEPIRVINLIDNSYIELSEGNGGKYPIISPDGKKIYFKKERELPIEE